MQKAIWTILLLVLVSFKNHANDIDQLCVKHIQPYRDNYIPDTGESPYTLEQRLAFLEGLPKPCNDYDYTIMFKSVVLFQMNEYQKSFNELDRGLALNDLKRRGNLLYSKASKLLTLKTSNVDIDETYEDIVEMLELAFKSENNFEHFIHLKLAEAKYRLKRYEEALEHAIASAESTPTHRAFTLIAILMQKSGNYRMAINSVQEAVALANNQSLFLQEPDTVLALTISLCAEKEYEWAYNIVGAAQALGEDYSRLPEMLTAANLVTEDSRCKPPKN